MDCARSRDLNCPANGERQDNHSFSYIFLSEPSRCTLAQKRTLELASERGPMSSSDIDVQAKIRHLNRILDAEPSSAFGPRYSVCSISQSMQSSAGQYIAGSRDKYSQM